MVTNSSCWKLSFLYIASFHSQRCLNVKTVHYQRENPQQSDAHLKGALGDSGKEETSNNRTRLEDGQLL